MTAQTDDVYWRGVNHLALITGDMDATVRFYHGVLGAQLVMTIATPAFKHYFFDIAPGNALAFFEYLGEPIGSFAKPAGVPYPQASQFDHLALALADEEALLRLRDRLKEHNEVTDVVDHGTLPPSTSPTRTASPSRRRGGSPTRPGGPWTTPTSGSSPTPIPSTQ